MEQERIRELSDEATTVLLNKPGTVSSTKGGWMMISTILIEAWDLYAIAFVLIFIKNEFNPTAGQLGLATAAVQGGALLGALLGGWVADKLGRKRVFILTMVLFIILAIAQAFAQNIWELIIMRFLIGIPLGSDIANGYAYIMESMPKSTRERMGSRWQGMFGLGEVFSIIVITIMYATGMNPISCGGWPSRWVPYRRSFSCWPGLTSPRHRSRCCTEATSRGQSRPRWSSSTTHWTCCRTKTSTLRSPRSQISSR
jgi:MFS family permease